MAQKSFSRRVVVLGGLSGILSFIQSKNIYALDNDTEEECQQFELNLNNLPPIYITETTEARIVQTLDNDGNLKQIVLNKETNIVYSEFTEDNSSLPQDELLPSISQDSGFRSTITNKKVKRFSYAQIGTAVGYGATAAQVVAYLIACIPGCYTIGSYLGTISEAVNKMAEMSTATPGNDNHGIQLTIATIKYYRTRGGHRRVWREDVQIVGATLY